MEWLLAMGKKVLRLNECDLLKSFRINNGSAQLQFLQLSTQQLIDVDVQAVEMFWFRKRSFNLQQWLQQQFANTDIDRYINRELDVVVNYIHFLLSRRPHLAVSFTASMNKLVVNDLATGVGLQIPDYVIGTRKQDLGHFLQQHNDDCITKAISETFFIQVENGFVVSYTEPAHECDLAAYDEQMMPVLLQNKVDKQYELRIFYLDGICYSSAIFSQNDKQTQVDFRKYNYAKPNRTVPYTLPQTVADSIHRLMQQLKLKTGSIDMLVSKKGEYVFLEVNPVGQFGMVSEPCNYFLEQKVAQYLAAAS